MPAKIARTLLFVSLLGAALASTGCIDFDRAITLNKDLSGKATFRMTVNLEPMARIVAQTERQASGKTGPITDEEIAAAKKELSSQASQQSKDPKAEIGPLPAGFTLIDASQKMDGLKMTISATIGFDDIRKLPTFKMSDPSPGGQGDHDQLQPFEGIEVKDEGATLVITAKLLTTGDSKMMAPGAPTGGDKPAPEGLPEVINQMTGMLGGDAAMTAQIEQIMKEMKETFRFETPMTVVETNATKREATAAVWEYTMESLAKGKTGADVKSPVMSVRVKK